MSYTKLFNSIITSTIWTEDDKTRIVWITMLAMADKNGEIQGSVPGLARVAGVPTEDCRAALAKFMMPDLDSRTKDDEGRRIEEIDGGWAMLNHAKYRAMASDADRAEKAAIRQARKRKNDKEKSRDSHAQSRTVTPKSRQNPQAEAEAEAEAEEYKKKEEPPNTQGGNSKSKGSIEELKAFSLKIGLPETDGESMFHHWESNGWKNGSSPCKNWQSGIQKWKSQGWLPSQKATRPTGGKHAGTTDMKFNGDEF